VAKVTQRRIFVYGLVFLAFCLVAIRIWLVNSRDEDNLSGQAGDMDRKDRSIQIQADHGDWVAIGRGPMLIRAEGTINLGGGHIAAPDDNRLPGNANALVPNLPLGVLVGKIGGSGEPFKIGRISQIAMTDVVYLAINDSDHSDNSGAYIIKISGDLIR
jgi:hypothetical protein